MWWKKRITTLTCPFLQFSLQTMKDEKQNNNYWKKWKGTNRNFGYKWPEKQSLTCVGWGSIWAPFPIPCPDAPPNTDCLLDSLPFYSFLHLQKIRKSAICRQLLYMFCCRKKERGCQCSKGLSTQQQVQQQQQQILNISCWCLVSQQKGGWWLIELVLFFCLHTHADTHRDKECVYMLVLCEFRFVAVVVWCMHHFKRPFHQKGVQQKLRLSDATKLPFFQDGGLVKKVL